MGEPLWPDRCPGCQEYGTRANHTCVDNLLLKLRALEADRYEARRLLKRATAMLDDKHDIHLHDENTDVCSYCTKLAIDDFLKRGE